MTRDLRMRWLTPALALLIAVGLSACSSFAPNTIFGAQSEFGHSVDVLTRRLLYAGLVVFVLIETLLVVILVRYRERDGNREAKQFHGNSTLEIGWTLIPAVILAFIAVPAPCRWRSSVINGGGSFVIRSTVSSRRTSSICRWAGRRISRSPRRTSSTPSGCRSSTASAT